MEKVSANIENKQELKNLNPYDVRTHGPFPAQAQH